MKNWKFLLVPLLIVGLLLSLGTINKAEAVKILGDSEGDLDSSGEFYLSGCGGECTYFAAYEYYGNEQVVAGGPNESDVVMKFKLGRAYTKEEGISIQLNGANFLSPGSIDWDADEYCLVDSSGNIKARQASSPSFPTDEIFLSFTANVPTDTVLTLAVCDIFPLEMERVVDRVQIKADLGASCDQTVDVKVRWNAIDDCCEAVLIKIKPKAKLASTLNFTAELDTDKDFKTFLDGNTILDTCCSRGDSECPIISCCKSTECLSTPTPPPAAGCPTVWVLGTNFNPATSAIVKMSFDINSTSAEPGIDKIRYKDTSITCTKASDTKWSCSFDCIPCPNCPEGDFLKVVLKGDTPNNPTVWSISNVSVSGICPTDPKVKDVCCSLKTGEVGVWFGGLETLVPFVKNDPAGGYYTTIKLINRYGSSVKVFAAPFTETSNPMIIPITEVGTIPSGGSITITGADLAGLFPTADFVSGVPVKINIRVKGAASAVGKDPYIEGIVVSDRVGYGSRSVPLKFKFWNHGAYAE